MSAHNRFSGHRRMLAYESARILSSQGAEGFDRARRKAAERLGVLDKRCWPSNEEIQEALLTQRRLFDGGAQVQTLRRLRTQALAAMRNFGTFQPRLVGSVLHGTGDAIQGVRLHLFADSPEDVVLALLGQGIPWHERETCLRFGGDQRHSLPVFEFQAGETPFDLVVLPIQALRSPPFDPVTDRPERGAGIADVERMVEEAEEPSRNSYLCEIGT